MQPQLSLQGYGGDFLIQHTSAVMDHYYQQQDISPGSAGVPSPNDSCSMHPMSVPMQLQQPGDFPSMPSMGMAPMFTPYQLGPDAGHPLRQRDFLRCRRKVDLTRMGYKSHPTAVARRNERERNRVKHINGTFSTLRQHLPCGAKNKKMSKVETLRSAIRYINHLRQILDAQDEDDVKSESDAVQSPHSTSATDCSDSDMNNIKSRSCIKTESDSGVELNNSDSSTCTENPNTDNSNSPDSRLHPTECNSKDNTTSSCSYEIHQCTVPVSPSCSTKSAGDSPVHSGYSSSDDPGYDTFAATEDELADLVDWLE